MKSMVSVILSLVVFVLLCLYIGDTKITFSPFSISIPGWRVLLSYFFLALTLYFYGNHQYIRGEKDTLIKVKEYFEEESERNKEVCGKYTMYLLRHSNPEILEKIDSLGYLPSSSLMGKEGWIIVIGTRYAIVEPGDETVEKSMDIVVDCSDNEEMFIELITDYNNKYNK